MDILELFVKNFLTFDWIIFAALAVNGVIYWRTLFSTNKVYGHFNTLDQMANLSGESRRKLKAHTRGKKELSAEDLLKYRTSMNKFYAVYTNLTSIFPLLGMLGTVCSLLPMVNTTGTGSAGSFFSALTSTLWGIVFAMLYKALDATLSYKIDDNEKHVEYYLKPDRDAPAEDAP